MLNGSQSLSNTTLVTEKKDLFVLVVIVTLSTVPSVIFLYINGTILFTLRSKAVFRDTSRYILLYNLLLTDTLQLAQSQMHFLFSICRLQMGYSICIVLNFFVNLTTVISPLTLVVMPLERYVAVCFPLRHSSIITIRNTNAVIIAIWAISSLNTLTRLFWFLKSSSEKNEIWQLKDLCSNIALVLGALTAEYDRAYTCVVFVSAGVAAIFSYVGVIRAARSASTDKALARRARYTLLLNMVQLGLSLSSTIYNPLMVAVSEVLTRLAVLWVRNVFYVCFIIVPRCLSSLIYGLRDPTIRPVLLYYLCCCPKVKFRG